MPHAYLLLLLASLAWPAQAAIYKYVDAEGNITFTDRYRPGARLIDGSGSGSTITSAPRRNRGQASNPSPSDFPKVDRQTQTRRDDVRHTLLMEERMNEETALSAVTGQLANGKTLAPADRARLTDSQRLHRKNIEMLDKELSRFK